MNIEQISLPSDWEEKYLKFGDGDGPNLCRVKKSRC